MRRRLWLITLAAALLRGAALAASPAGDAAATASPRLVIFDNDWTDGVALVPLLAAPHVRLLGLTVVIGDTGRDRSAAELRGALQRSGAAHLPVRLGAAAPLLNTPARLAAWERLNGTVPWKGAWNAPAAGASAGAGAATAATPGQPEDPESAAAFIVRQIRALPGQVTLLAAGPLTNVALALALDPGIAALARELVVVGGNLAQVKRDGSVKSDFNLIFDPEAADKVLRAPWPRIVAVGDALDDALPTAADLSTLAGCGPVAASDAARRLSPRRPLWDEAAAALVADPSLILAMRPLMMAVDTGDGPFRGRARVWQKGAEPASGVREVEVVGAIDVVRLRATFVGNACAPPVLPTAPR